jgi:hypothetical protein
MSGGAHVDSFDAVRDFRAAVATFADEARDALAVYDMELRRTLDWLLEFQPGDWQQELRSAEEAIRVAKIELGRCRTQKLPGGGEPSCMEEKKALERAKRRHQFAEDKLTVTRKWGQTFSRDATQYTSQAAQLSDLFDADLPRALAMLDQALRSLEAYAGLSSSRSQSSSQTTKPSAAATGTAAAAKAGEEKPAGEKAKELNSDEQTAGEPPATPPGAPS